MELSGSGRYLKMMDKNSFHLRFAVGSPKGPRSSIWRLWTAKSPKFDVYLAARHIAGLLKASLHESEEWRVSFTYEYASKLKRNGDWTKNTRDIDKWQRPPEISPGVTLAFRIILPASELRIMPFSEEKNKPIMWVNPPPNGCTTEFAVIFTKPEINISDWPGKTVMGTSLLAKEILANKETLWLVYRSHEITEGLYKRIQDVRLKITSRPPVFSHGTVNLNHPNLRLIIGGDEPDGSRFYMEIAGDTFFSWFDTRSK
jgi:hypothetical protein